MPYITQKQRECINNGASPQDAGELNYLITTIILQYIREHGTKYQNMNDVIGALEGAKLELYRRHIATYEDQKISENGDV